MQQNSRQHRQRWALLRLEVIGHLLASPPQDGALQASLKALAQSTWRHPLTGADVRFGFSTIERWLLRARKHADPVARLTAQGRADAGAQRAISAEVAAAIRAQYARSPQWTIQLHYDNLKADCLAKAVTSSPTVIVDGALCASNTPPGRTITSSSTVMTASGGTKQAPFTVMLS